MRLTQRTATYFLQLLMLTGFAAVIVLEGPIRPLATTLARLLGFAAEAAALAAFWRGARHAQTAMVLLSALIVPAVVANTGYDASNTLALLVPPIFALIIGRPWLVPAAAATSLALFLARDAGTLWVHHPVFYVLYAMIVGGMAVARSVMDTAQQDAGLSARRVADALAASEQQALALAESNRGMEEQLRQQERLLSLVDTLEAPAVPLAEGVLFAPVVGFLDTRRSEALTRRLLADAHAHRARLVLLDIGGVPEVDAAVARALLNTAHALRLLGCEVTISGISSRVAATLVQLGVDLSAVSTARSPQEVLARHISAYESPRA